MEGTKIKNEKNALNVFPATKQTGGKVSTKMAHLLQGLSVILQRENARAVLPRSMGAAPPSFVRAQARSLLDGPGEEDL